MRIDRLALAAVLASSALLATEHASAYCRTTTCSPKKCASKPECAYCLDGGLPLYWPGGCLTFSVQEDGSPLRGITAEETNTLVSNGLWKWMNAECSPSEHPSLAIKTTPPVVCHKQEYNQDSPNANIWMYRDDAWPYTGATATLALTTVTYNVETGEIFDADVEINSVGSPLTLGDENVQADLDSIVTHEAGHFLGLSHSCESNATMYAYYQLGDTSLRSLEADDIAGICDVYPPGASTGSCDPTPRHGFSPECGTESDPKGCCATAPGRPDRNGTGAVLALLVGAGAVVARRRRRNARGSRTHLRP